MPLTETPLVRLFCLAFAPALVVGGVAGLALSDLPDNFIHLTLGILGLGLGWVARAPSSG